MISLPELTKVLFFSTLRETSKMKPKILFLCTGNACRSQMAEGWAKHLKSDRLEPYSAGIAPAGLFHFTIRAMAECGVDISQHWSKHPDDLKDLHFDYVITVCGHAHEQCPHFFGDATVVHVPFDDPPTLSQFATTDEEVLVHYRRIRDEIRKYVDGLPDSLPGSPACKEISA